MVEFIEGLGRWQKKAVAIALDCVALPFALWCALAVRYGGWNPAAIDFTTFWPVFGAALLVGVPAFAVVGLYRHIIRYMGWEAIGAVMKGVTIATIAVIAVAYMLPMPGFPRSAPVIFWLLSFCYVAGTRFAVRAYAERVVRTDAARKRVVIYGAGEAGAQLARRLNHDRDYRPVAIVDADRREHGRVIHGLAVHPVEALPTLIADHVARHVLVAMPDASVAERRDVIASLEPYPVHVRVVPAFEDWVAGTDPLAGVREIDIGDLLGRNEVSPLPHLLRGSVAGRSVLVTGAGGSIGSELCRQISRLQPRRLVLLDQNEYALFRVENELARACADEEVPVVAVLGSVLDRALVERTLRAHRVDTVYHAAAYKHVSLVENNVTQGIKNNTFGTLRAAQAALAAGVSRFILISTDKAVRTRSVMGASKRLAEMALQALQERSGRTRFAVVRFGNVLVSSGSVVPLFLEQIDKGGPVTVTHADASRYFMTLSEAAELVLQAASLAAGGEVFVLDMGKAVSIHELAQKTIRLRGYTVRDEANPHGDIEIEFIGLRPGEKLKEELLTGDASGTEHRKILCAAESHKPWSELRPTLDALLRACDAFDYRAIKRAIEAMVEGADLAELVEPGPPDNVVPMPARESAEAGG